MFPFLICLACETKIALACVVGTMFGCLLKHSVSNFFFFWGGGGGGGGVNKWILVLSETNQSQCYFSMAEHRVHDQVDPPLLPPVKLGVLYLGTGFGVNHVRIFSPLTLNVYTVDHVTRLCLICMHWLPWIRLLLTWHSHEYM